MVEKMASGEKGTSFVKPNRMKGIIALLTSAACEWLLIFLMLLDALFSYTLTMFARYCQLEMPCLLCSRLDHILRRERPKFYDNLFCNTHKSEISSLVLCHVHGKIADGHRMCDDCLLSVTGKSKNNAKSHRLLVGKFGVVLGGSGNQSPSLSRDLFSASKGSRLCTRQCTCCGKLWKSEHNSPRSIQLRSPGKAVLKPYIPLPCPPRQSRLNHRDNMKRMRDKFSDLEGKNNFQPLSHVGYSELRFNSDSESEFPFSDDDDVSSVYNEDIEASNGPMAQNTSTTSTKCIPSYSHQEKPNGSSAKPMPLPSDQRVEPNVNKDHDVNTNCAEEINLQQGNQEPLCSDRLELHSQDEVSTSPIVMKVCNRESESEDNKITYPSQDPVSAPLSEPTTLNGTHAHDGASSEKFEDVAQASTETDSVVCDFAPINPRQENSSNMNNSFVATKEREETGFVKEQPTTEEVDKVNEELERSPLESSSPQGSNISSAVPIDHVHSPETHAEASSSNGVQVLQKSSSVESSLESLDGSNIVEFEGEPDEDSLKRQIEYYKKCMDSLQKELEEERNASAVATNEALSMITRLQEEKASLQMEALQYLRMMEEQAEYDNDELDKVNDLLTEKEKEIQDLEAELEFYRLNPENDEAMVHNMHEESWDFKGENVKSQNTGIHDIPNTISNISSLKNVEVSKNDDEGETLIFEFEEEKEYILRCLKDLEEKVHQISSNAPNDRLEELEVSKTNQEGASNSERPLMDGHEEIDFSTQKDIKKDASTASNSDDCSLGVDSTSPKQEISTPRTEVELELVALGNEISDLNDRLEALEFDRDLLAHLTNYVRHANDGKQFIQDIARRLHELQKFASR